MHLILENIIWKHVAHPSRYPAWQDFLLNNVFVYFRLEALRKKSSIGHGRDYWVKRGESVDIEFDANFIENHKGVGKPNLAKMNDKMLQCGDKSDECCSVSQGIESQTKEDLSNDLNSDIQDSLVGYSSLPSQVHRKAVRKGFEFVVLVVGETGLGKSTFINSLFMTDI